MNLGDLMTTEELLEVLRVDRRNLLERIAPQPGFPRPYEVSRKQKLWPKSEVERWLQSRRA